MSAAVSEANTLTRQLWHIAGTGDLEQLDELLSRGADVNAADRTGVTALMRAAYHGQLAMVRALIFYGADLNARDRSGLTALMMAEYGGHEEIVEALRLIGAQREVARKPLVVASVTEENADAATQHEDPTTGETSQIVGKPHVVASVTEANVETATEYGDSTTGETSQVAREPRVLASVTEENVDVAPDYDDWESGKDSQTARTLHAPLEIWEMVHTTQTESYSPSARPGRVFSRRILALAVGALIICSGAVFGFLALRGALSATDDTSEQRSEATALKQTSSSNERLSVSNSLTTAPGKITRSSNELTQPKPVGKLIGERVDPPTVASSVSSAKRSSASQRPKATKVSAAFPKQNKNVRRATALESEQSASSKSVKKAPAPAASDPVKPSTTQKPKVIQWP